jgi:DNA polymerase-1
MTREPLFLIDGSGYIFRAYYAVRRLTTAAGFSTNAVFGFTNMLLRVLREHRPTHIAIVFDAGGKNFRHALYDRYKANRPPPPEDLPPQLPFIEQVVDAFRIPQFRVKGVEADDVIGTIARRAEADGIPIRIITGDKDFMQLVDDRVHLIDELRLQRATSEQSEVDPSEVEKKFGVLPPFVVDILALAGDSSDNVPGVKGIGEKTAAELVKAFGHVEDILARAHEIKQNARRERLLADADMARLSKALVTIKTDVDIPFDFEKFVYSGPDRERLRALFVELEFKRLLDDPILQTPRDPSSTANESAAKKAGALKAKSGPSPQGDLFATTNAIAQEKSPDDTPPVSRVAIDRGAYAVVDTRAGLVEMVESELLAADDVALAILTDDVEREPERIVGLALSPRAGRAVYVPLAHASGNVSFDDVRAVLGPVFTRPGGLIVDDAKGALRALVTIGFPEPHVAFDPGIASYLLDPDANGHDIAAVSERELHHRAPVREDVLGKGKGTRTAASASPDDVLALVAERADLTWRVHAPLRAAVNGAEMSTLMNEIELPLSPVLADMERTGVLVDTTRLAHLGTDFEDEMRSLEERAHVLAGEDFNLQSPTQIAALLFEKLKLTPKKKTKTGLSTDASVLEELKDEHPLPGVILEHRELAKLKGTYVDALPRLVRRDTGRIHTRFHQTVAATGRLSSSDPNLQNIPVRKTIGKKIREAFIAPFGRVLISLDYSQIELRLLAHASDDPVLIDTFLKGDDVHQRTAAEIFDVPLAQVAKDQRNAAKTINFGLLYGMGVHRLSGELGVKRSEAKAFLDRYFERYAGIAAWKNSVLARANAEGSVRTLFGRRRLLPQLQSQNRGEVALGERLAINTPIQGTAADLIKRAMIDAHRALALELPSARLILQVHDELLVEASADDAERAMAVVRQAMVNAMHLKVPLVVDAAIGASWAAIH